MDRRIQGSSLRGIVSFIHTALPPEKKARVLSVVPPERLAIENLPPNELFPMDRSNELVRAIASTFDDEAECYAAFIECGELIADDAINSYLRLLIQNLKPELFARTYGHFFRRAHTFGNVEASCFTPQSFTLEMSDVAGYLYVAPLSIGFMKHTLTAMGCRNVRLEEMRSPPPKLQDVASYRIEVSWS